MNAKLRNSGTTLMVLQEQYNHQKRLTEIYTKQPSIANIMGSTQSIFNRKNKKKEKINQYVKQQHLKNIKKLVENITQQRTILQRKKDQNDFFAYPALFFRQVTIPLKRVKSAQNVKKVKRDFQQSSLSTPKITLQKVKQFLPTLHSFQQQDLEEWLDGVNKLIITFNIMRKDHLIDLCQKIISVLPKKCPQYFREAVQNQLLDICNQA